MNRTHRAFAARSLAANTPEEVTFGDPRAHCIITVLFEGTAGLHEVLIETNFVLAAPGGALPIGQRQSELRCHVDAQCGDSQV